MGNNSEDLPRKNRILDEIHLLKELLNVVDKNHRKIINRLRLERDIDPEGTKSNKLLTEKEVAVFNRYTYHNWSAGITAGLLTFGILNGVSYLRMRRRTGYKLPPPPRPSYKDLDRGGKAKKTKPILQQEEAEPMAVSDDTMSQLQFMVYGAISLFIMTFTASRKADQPRFFRDLSTLPLQPGKSILCNQMCPESIQKLQSLQISTEPLPKGNRAADLLKDPETEELERLVQLVHNCRQRMQYEADHRSSDEEGPINVETEIPANYIGVNAKDIEWTNGLVIDQEDDGR